MSLYQDSTGVEVDYTIDVYDNNDYYDQVRERLEECRPIDRDLMMLTDWMAARMVWAGWIQEIDAARVPNLHANLIPALRNAAWDPTLSYHAPWQTGLTGIAYNAALVPAVGSFTELLTRADLKGNVTLLSEMNDTMGFMLTINGADPEDFTTQEWGVAMEQLREITASGHIREFTGNEYKKALVRGDILACEAWSGDVIQAQFYNPNIKFVVPEEGLAVWSDNMLIPNGATHKANAELWINHFYEPAVAAKLASWVNYICPVEGARAGDGEDRPVAGRQPADLPRREDARRGVRVHVARRPPAAGVRRRLGRAHERLTGPGPARSKESCPARHRPRCTSEGRDLCPLPSGSCGGKLRE